MHVRACSTCALSPLQLTFTDTVFLLAVAGLPLQCPVAYTGIWKGGGHVGVWGLAPSGVQGQRPGGGFAPLKLKGFL